MENQKGFSLIELIFSIFLAALFLPALSFVYSFSLGSAGQGENYTRAYAIAQQQMEVVYYLKQNDYLWDWENYPENNSTHDFYQPQAILDVWTLGTKVNESNLVEINGYTASVKILPVYRSTQGEIVGQDDGILDPSSRKIIINVSWEEKGIPTSVDLVSYVTNHS